MVLEKLVSSDSIPLCVLLMQAAAAKAAELCKTQGKSISHLALQFALRNRSIPTTLVGMTSINEVGCQYRILLLLCIKQSEGMPLNLNSANGD